MAWGREAVSPDGTVWRVRRRWVGRRVRLRRERGNGGNGGDGGSGDGISAPDWLVPDDAGGLVIGIATLVLVTFLFLVVWPIVAIALELLILALLVAGGGLARVVLRKPWRIEATARRRPALAWHARGWRNSGRAIGRIAEALERGDPEAHVPGAVLVGESRSLSGSGGRR